MARVKKRRELTHQEKQILRARDYSKLMQIKIPKREFKAEIVEGMYYVIYEENLLKPKLLKYSFRGYYHAQKYCDKHLSKHRYNILEGSILIGFGFDKAHKSLRSVSGIKGAGAFNYTYPKELDAQRKKTLRTMYRRNYRRLLAKLLKYEEDTERN